MQGEDNDYYMNHNYKGEKVKTGSIFLDKDYDWSIPSSNLLMYGHNKKSDTTMFSDLLNDLRRIAAHCGNIATSVIQLQDSSIDKHEYNHRNKDEDVVFVSRYEDFKSRYSVSRKKDIEKV